jgi:hypothetical protein
MGLRLVQKDFICVQWFQVILEPEVLPQLVAVVNHFQPKPTSEYRSQVSEYLINQYNGQKSRK